MQATEIEDTLKRIHAHKGVVGTIIVNSEGLFDIMFLTLSVAMGVGCINILSKCFLEPQILNRFAGKKNMQALFELIHASQNNCYNVCKFSK